MGKWWRLVSQGGSPIAIRQKLAKAEFQFMRYFGAHYGAKPLTGALRARVSFRHRLSHPSVSAALITAHNKKPTIWVGFGYCCIICPWGEA
ncbi:hypothetical protein CUB86_04360 [Pseudomonas syringae pv. actinidiae]|uniref:Uncharacterized protein n=1 Tax=Pseudomonas syringae pv. actinidiae TaxID=103796 RepID=A0AAU8XQS0_PSESF|nr:hypothetical protein CT122_30630 [Pseudomonas syringae pv. actinidiae]PIN62648.1 hypothetical protein CUB86_04360 [Pseudomonas syringae pv. actinidiae]